MYPCFLYSRLFDRILELFLQCGIFFVFILFQGMEELVNAGMVENIGLSNFNKAQIERILQTAKIKPCNLQVRNNKYKCIIYYWIY